MSGTSPKWSIPYSGGSDIANTIDDVDEAKVLLLDDLVTPFDAGARSSRPRSNTGGQPGIAGRTYRSPDGGVDLDLGTSWTTVKPGLFSVPPTVSGDASDGLDAGMEILFQTAGMAAAGIAPVIMRYSGSAWEDMSGPTNLRRGLAVGYLNANFLATSGTVLVLTAEEVDISSWFSTSTGLYTPQVAGYYRISWALRTTTVVDTSSGVFSSRLLKSGAEHRNGSSVTASHTTSSELASSGSAVVAANGTTDTFGIAPLIALSGVSSQTLKGGAANCYMHCEMVAAA